MAEEPKSHGWWQTIPGILTATAGIITAITGLIVGLNQTGFFAEDERLAKDKAAIGRANVAPTGTAITPAATRSTAKPPGPQPQSGELQRLAGKWSGWARDREGHQVAASAEIKDDGSFRISSHFTDAQRGAMRIDGKLILFETGLKTTGTVTVGMDGEKNDVLTFEGLKKPDDPDPRFQLPDGPISIKLTRVR